MEIRKPVTLLILLKQLPIPPRSFALSPYDHMWCVVSSTPGLGVYQFSSAAQSCLTLWDPTDCSMPGFPVHHQLPELAQTHVYQVSDAIQPSHPLLSSSAFQSFPASGSFLMSRLFTSGGQSIGTSASVSVLPMNIQSWFPLGLIGWISLQSKGLARVFFNTTVQKHQFFSAQLSL